MDPTKGRTSRRSSAERRIINSLMEKRCGLPHQNQSLVSSVESKKSALDLCFA